MIGCCVAVLRSHWSAVPTLLFIYKSQLLRDSFFVSQQPPIWEPPSHFSMVWRQSQLKLINIYNFLNIRLSNNFLYQYYFFWSANVQLSLKLPVQQIHVVSLSLLHKLLIVQHEAVGGEANDVDHDDEHLRRQIHPLDAVHHLQNFAEMILLL